MQLTGDLSKVSLANLLQLVRNGELTGKVSMLQGAKTANVYIDRGQVIHVELDMSYGREALMELFLWVSGSFSFIEQDLADVPRSLSPQNKEDTLERLVRDGLTYLDQRRYLDRLNVNGQTVLAANELAWQPQTWSTPARALLYPIVEPILARIDGRRTLAEALVDAKLTRRAFVTAVHALLTSGLAEIRQPEPDFYEHGERVSLPSWVVSRLKQDNADLSQAIVDMVIWVDRVKCWMYQVDVDFTRLLDELALQEEVDAPSEDFFLELQRGNVDVEEPLFGEPSIPVNLETSASARNTASSNQSGNVADRAQISPSQPEVIANSQAVSRANPNSRKPDPIHRPKAGTPRAHAPKQSGDPQDRKEKEPNSRDGGRPKSSAIEQPDELAGSEKNTPSIEF